MLRFSGLSVKIGLVLNKRWVFMKKLLILDRMSKIKMVLPKSISCFDKPVLSESEAERTVHPSRASGRTVFSECPERSRRKGSCFDKLSRTEKVYDFKITPLALRLSKGKWLVWETAC
jgi:hypothetical protein